MRPTRFSVSFFVRNTENQIKRGKECINSGTVEELYEPKKTKKKTKKEPNISKFIFIYGVETLDSLTFQNLHMDTFRKVYYKSCKYQSTEY